jgi:hypothetical protein
MTLDEKVALIKRVGKRRCRSIIEIEKFFLIRYKQNHNMLQTDFKLLDIIDKHTIGRFSINEEVRVEDEQDAIILNLIL